MIFANTVIINLNSPCVFSLDVDRFGISMPFHAKKRGRKANQPFTLFKKGDAYRTAHSIKNIRPNPAYPKDIKFSGAESLALFNFLMHVFVKD